MADLMKVSIKGQMPGGEVWSVNPVFSLPIGTSINYDELLPIATAIAALTVPTGLRAIWSPQTYITGVRLELRTLADDLEVNAEAAVPSPAFGSGSSRLVYQSSVCVSLATGTPGGRGRGRIYWPATGAGVDTTTLRLDSTLRAGVLAGTKSYFEAITGAIDGLIAGGTALMVFSRTAPDLYPVNRLRVGDVIDTQRRRRDALAETYVSVDYGII